ncbi:GntR family transcriptional regulator [Pelomonas sp. SE-A7]|uniref:GntR family transcriptional regulator n=1 Tax=Pelomonas sp. SE-A7 TaxID=3054953 RepID=UPI00259C8706|nr:GntR family transcriptional regulator [Pelomonas sp. SE-A7]MDM4765292.1 GntR family transcriptional regulator [Pelomonas sp. SE-A7]
MSTAAKASDPVYQALRQRILALQLAPGERINEKELAAEFGLSRTPVHEAVQRLTEEGLIEIRPRSGTFVARIPVHELEEAMLVRTALELAMIERAAARLTPQALKQLDDWLAEQRRCAKRSDQAGFHRADEGFHACLAELAGFPGVWRTIAQAKTQVDRFRRLTLPIQGRMQEVIAEHQAVVEALRSGAPDKAMAAMRRHLDQVLPAIALTRSLQPDYFVNRPTA